MPLVGNSPFVTKVALHKLAIFSHFGPGKFIKKVNMKVCVDFLSFFRLKDAIYAQKFEDIHVFINSKPKVRTLDIHVEDKTLT